MNLLKILLQRIEQWNYDRIIRHVPNITGIVDLLGEKKSGQANRSTILLYILPHLYGRLLENDPDRVLSQRSINFRQKYLCNTLRKNAQVLLRNKTLIIEKNLMPSDGKPVIFASNHSFFEDSVTISLATNRNSYYMYGSISSAFNSIIGLIVYLNGFILVNRKDQSSKKASIEKAVRALELGTSIYFYPEGVWNKTANQFTLKFWPGIIKIAQRKNTPIVPVIQLLVGEKIYISILKSFDVSKYSQDQYNEALEDLRTIYNTELMELMEKYAQVKRNDLLGSYTCMTDMYEDYLEHIVAASGNFYDYSVESTAAYQSSNITLAEDVWTPIAQLEITPANAKEVVYARKLVERLRREDFQRRF